MTTEKNPTTGQVIEHFGPTIEFLTAPQEVRNDFCALKGVIAPGGIVPLHSHPDTEDFLVVSGRVQALKYVPGGHEWIEGQAGDYFHIPSGVKHAWRNISQEPLVVMIFTTISLARYFQEAGRPVAAAQHPVTPEELAHLMTVSTSYRIWLATPEENAAIGLHVGA